MLDQPRLKSLAVSSKALVPMHGNAASNHCRTKGIKSSAVQSPKAGMALRYRANSNSCRFRWPGPSGSVARITSAMDVTQTGGGEEEDKDAGGGQDETQTTCVASSVCS